MNICSKITLAMPMLGALSACIGDLRPGAGSGCGVEAAHPSANQGFAVNGCLIASFGHTRLPFCAGHA